MSDQQETSAQMQAWRIELDNGTRMTYITPVHRTLPEMERAIFERFRKKMKTGEIISGKQNR